VYPMLQFVWPVGLRSRQATRQSLGGLSVARTDKEARPLGYNIWFGGVGSRLWPDIHTRQASDVSAPPMFSEQLCLEERHFRKFRGE